MESMLAEDGELDAEVTHRVQSGWKNWKRVWSVVRQKHECEDQGECVRPVWVYGAEKKAHEKK